MADAEARHDEPVVRPLLHEPSSRRGLFRSLRNVVMVTLAVGAVTAGCDEGSSVPGFISDG